MNWTNWNDFFAMGGYALYVWGSYGVTFVLLLAEIVLLILRKRSVIGRLVRRAPQVTQ